MPSLDLPVGLSPSLVGMLAGMMNSSTEMKMATVASVT